MIRKRLQVSWVILPDATWPQRQAGRCRLTEVIMTLSCGLREAFCNINSVRSYRSVYSARTHCLQMPSSHRPVYGSSEITQVHWHALGDTSCDTSSNFAAEVAEGTSRRFTSHDARLKYAHAAATEKFT